MKPWQAWALLTLGLTMPWLAHAGSKPTQVTLADGTQLGIEGIFQYDWAAFRDGRLPDGQRRFDDGQGWERQELEAYVQRKGVFRITTGYDFANREWVGNYLTLDTPAGRFRVGEFITLVGWESADVAIAATKFIEPALPDLVVFEGYRAGIGWRYKDLKHWTFQVQWFAPHDLNHEGDGRTVAARVVYAPIQRDKEVIHLGVSASRERREGHHARFDASPETGLTPIHLVDTGVLDGVQHIDRSGLEAAWMNGPLLVQGEYLNLRAVRRTAADFDTHGWYVSGSWMLTGESHTYQNTVFGKPKPLHPWGAIGVGVRYSRIDLDDGDVTGGIEHDWTIGINWYIGTNFKVQANDVYAVAESGNLPVNPHIYELRAQMTF